MLATTHPHFFATCHKIEQGNLEHTLTHGRCDMSQATSAKISHPQHVAKSIAAFNTAYTNWLLRNGFWEQVQGRTNESYYCNIKNSTGESQGIASYELDGIELYLGHQDTHGLKITTIDYLSVPDSYSIIIWNPSFDKCWLRHKLPQYRTVCDFCAASRRRLHEVREAGRTWMLTDTLHDIKLLIARCLSQLGVPF